MASSRAMGTKPPTVTAGISSMRVRSGPDQRRCGRWPPLWPRPPIGARVLSLAELFGDRMQLVSWHIMFGPDWDAACPTCTNFMNELSPAELSRLGECQTAFALVSRTPPGQDQGLPEEPRLDAALVFLLRQRLQL